MMGYIVTRVTRGAIIRAKQKYARQHRHGTVRYGADKVDRETLVETAPSLKVYDFPRGVYDTRSLARRA